MNDQLKHTLRQKLLSTADDELILAHRNSEWTGHAPILEEDIAFSNIAQDELGHASLFYGLVQALTGEEPDQLVFFRESADFRNVQMVELPKGDWAFSMVRQYLFDAFEMARTTRLVDSHYQPLADAAAKIRQEELYHYRHTSQWVRRLGLGTGESHSRTQTALNILWPYAFQLFVPIEGEHELITAGFFPNPETLRSSWEMVVIRHLKDAGLQIPVVETVPASDRRDHTEYLSLLVTELQGVARSDPEAVW
ncbi:MAG: 1,2-phenylacetyl-CoA epoxidase subunit PaaC [Candidatus Promineifilaceae bacterium]